MHTLKDLQVSFFLSTNNFRLSYWMRAINSHWARAQSYNILCISLAINPGHVMLTMEWTILFYSLLISYANTNPAYWPALNGFPYIVSSSKEAGLRCPSLPCHEIVLQKHLQMLSIFVVQPAIWVRIIGCCCGQFCHGGCQCWRDGA